MHRDTGCKARVGSVFLRLIGDHHHPPHAFGMHLVSDHGHRQRSVHGLATGHGDGVVIKNLECDVGAGCYGCANRQEPRMKIGTIADVLEYVLARTEGRLPDPARPFRAHLCVAGSLAIHPLRHVVTADPRQGPTAFGNTGGCIVRTARTEVRQTLHGRRLVRHPLVERPKRGHPCRHRCIRLMHQQLLADNDCNLVAVQPPGGRKLQPSVAVVLTRDCRRVLLPI